jgi:hypothetical protein
MAGDRRTQQDRTPPCYSRWRAVLVVLRMVPPAGHHKDENRGVTVTFREERGFLRRADRMRWAPA